METSILDKLNVRVEGSGDKYIVLGHCFGSDQSSWRHVLPYFTRHYKVVLYDLVFAGSVNPNYFDYHRYATLEAYADDLLLILDSLHITRCAYVGHSISGSIGMLASIRRPELFSKLILLCASPSCLKDGDNYQGPLEQGEIEGYLSTMASNYEAWVNDVVPLLVGVDDLTKVREFSRTLLNMRPEISLFVMKTVLNSDLRGILGQVSVPCYIMQTMRDVSATVVTYMKEHLGGNSTMVHWLDAKGHHPNLTAPSYLAHQIEIALGIER